MYAHNAAATYKQVHVSSSPARILEGLYRRVEDDLSDAIDALEEGDVKRRAEVSNHALRIVSELAGSLDRTNAPELCDQLDRLYDFMEAKILEGGIKKDPKAFEAARSVATTLRDAFAQASGVR